MSRVVILGCGPAGLAAASAAVGSGHEAIIISNTDRQSTIYGCQYLHAPIPGYEDARSVRVSYRLNGTPDDYRIKVYGPNWTGRVSPEDFVGEHEAWDIRETYSRMWRDLIGSLKVGLIMKWVKTGMIPFVASLHPDLVVSTIPATALCVYPSIHRFTSHTIYADGSTSPFSGPGDMEANTVVCDGTPDRSWYRASNVFGYRTTEWAQKPAPGDKATPVVKPLWTDCDCHPEVLRAGRYGAWEKARLVHEVPAAVLEALAPRFLA